MQPLPIDPLVPDVIATLTRAARLVLRSPPGAGKTTRVPEGRETPLRLSAADLNERLRILHARRVTIAGEGHHPHLEQPEAFARAVIPFLDEARRE